MQKVGQPAGGINIRLMSNVADLHGQFIHCHSRPCTNNGWAGCRLLHRKACQMVTVLKGSLEQESPCAELRW